MAMRGWENMTEADVARMGRQGPKSPISVHSSRLKSSGKGKVAPQSSTSHKAHKQPTSGTRSKYGVKTDAAGKLARTVDGVTFDSLAEARYYGELLVRLKVGEIIEVELQPVYELKVGAVVIGTYLADFRFFEWDGQTWARVVIDVKGFKTPLYRWKKKHVEAQYDIVIREIHD